MTVVPLQIISNVTQIRDESLICYLLLYIYTLWYWSEMLQAPRMSLRKLVFNVWILFKEMGIL